MTGFIIIAYMVIALVTAVILMVIDINNGTRPDDDSLGANMFYGAIWPFTLACLLLLGLCEGLKKIAVWLAEKMRDIKWAQKISKD